MLSIHHIVTTGAVALTLAVPGSVAAQPDMQSSAARDSSRTASAGGHVHRGHDRHAADRTLATRAARASAARPARDSAGYVHRGHDLHAADRTLVNAAAQPSVVPPASDSAGGFDWNDAAVGAIGTLGVIVALGGLAVITLHHRRGTPAAGFATTRGSADR